MKYLLPQGIGDSVWALHKLQSVSNKIGDGRIDVYLNCSDVNQPIQVRALDFVKRFDFVDNSFMLQMSIHPNTPVDDLGRYNYIQSGLTPLFGHMFYVLMPNGHLERGMRLENWLPDFEINWNLMDHFQISDEEKKAGDELKKEMGEYAVFYLGPLEGNLYCGHNRGPMWKPEEWVDLGEKLHKEMGLNIVVVGAPYDDMYYATSVEPLLAKRKIDYWADLIGRTGIGELYSITSKSRFVISYQSGVGIVSSYLGIPTGIFWRPKGNSLNPDMYISFEETMASDWVRPDMLEKGKHLPLIYGRHNVDYIVGEAQRRGW